MPKAAAFRKVKGIHLIVQGLGGFIGIDQFRVPAAGSGKSAAQINGTRVVPIKVNLRIRSMLRNRRPGRPIRGAN